MRIAALYDIHGNVPALEAVLDDVRRAGVDAVVIGGDVVAGPMPGETLERLAELHVPVHYVRGNADRETVAAFDQGRSDPEQETDPVKQETAFTAARLSESQRDLLAGWPTTLTLDVNGLGPVLFCHGSPRSDDEILTSATSDERLAQVLGDAPAKTIVGGHTHRQFERPVANRRYVNAGSIGRPYEGRPGAFWALLDAEINFRQTEYDVERARELLRSTGFPDIDGMLRDSLIEPLNADDVAAEFESNASG